MKEEYDTKNTLYEKLDEYAKTDYYAFHMPGHKRNMKDESSVYTCDITEIEGFDNLHNPQGIIKERLEKVASYYQSQKSYYLINGSTCGILTAISAVMEGKKKLIMARNCHKSVYNAVFLTKAETEYVYPEYDCNCGIFGAVKPQQIQELCKENTDDIGGIVITSPTYEGVLSDIKKIAHIAHEKGIPLIVDEAHGAHLGINPYFPKSALDCGADIVIQSLHKTLPALTQTAILHIGRHSLVNRTVIERYLAIYQTSSPSYVLMRSIDKCMDMIMQDSCEALFTDYCSMLDEFRMRCERCQYFKLWYPNKQLAAYDYDKSKLVIVPDERYYNGKYLYEVLLTKYHLQLEMASEKYVIAMTSVYDTQEGFNRLYEALEELEFEIDRTIKKDNFETKQVDVNEKKKFKNIQKAVICQKISDAYFQKYDIIELDKSIGRISGEFVYLYPPGVPILAPGERITKIIVDSVVRYYELGLNIQGLEDMEIKGIKVVKEN